jgi:hypothetical protein
MSEWHYSSNGQQLGPVTSAQLKQLAGSGQLQASDMVWKDGMADWAPASRIKGLFDGAAVAAARPAGGGAGGAAVATIPVAVAAAVAPRPAVVAPHQQQHQQPQDTFPESQQPTASPIGYYNPSAGLSERVARTLKGFPPASSMHGDWPLTEMHLAQLKEAEKQRKSIRGFNSLCQLGVFLNALSTLGYLIGLVGALMGPGGSLLFRGDSIAFIGGALSGSLGMAVLCYLAGRAAMKCRIWGPITIGTLFVLGLLWIVASFVMASSFGPSTRSELMLIPILVVALIGGALIYVCVRALLAIPRFRAAPVWAQEALVNAKL